MTWAAEIQLVRGPLSGWDYAARPIAFPGEDFDAKELRTGDSEAPGEWIDLDVDHTLARYLASGGGMARQIDGVIDAAICLEPVAQDRLKIAQTADLLEAVYKAASTSEIHFRINEANLTDVFLWDDAWLRADWTCPFERWEDIGETQEPLLTGQSGNQLTVNQASHGLTAAEWIGRTGGSWVVADASTSVQARGVVSSVTDASNFTVTTGDVVRINSHGVTVGPFWLGESGAVVSSEPALGTPRQALGEAIDANYIIVQIGELTTG